MRIWLLPLLFILPVLKLQAQSDPLATKDFEAQEKWVNEKYEAMSVEERIGQLFMVMANSSSGKGIEDKITKWIDDFKIGGVVFSAGGPVRQAKITNFFQSRSKTPLLIALDAEWGIAMRLDSTYAYPWNMTLGAIQDSVLLEQIGYQIGRHATRLGIHINFAPVVDININPQNPIIGNRSFGENPEEVFAKSKQLMFGMHRAGLLTSAKHFPGHGDTATDSHHALPIISFSRSRLDSVELLPFRKLIRAGLPSVMVAHLDVPALTGSKGIPTSLSDSLLQNLLRQEMGFNGLVFTDALNMKGFTAPDKQMNASLAAFLAGNDILLMPENLEADRQVLINAFQSGQITEERLAYSVKKILKAKYKAGLHQYRPVELENLIQDLNTPVDDVLYERAMEEAITVLKNKDGIIGIKNLEKHKIGYLKLGDSDHESFLNRLRLYAEITEINNVSELLVNPKKFTLLIAGVHESNSNPWKAHKLSDEDFAKLKVLNALPEVKTILTVFAKPYMLADIKDYSSFDAVVLGYQNSRIGQETTAELLFGVFPAKGKLPVMANPGFPRGRGLTTEVLKRIGYSIPARVNLDEQKLTLIDTLVGRGLDSLYFPGAQVLVARHGQVIYHKAFGYATYDYKHKVALNDVYDLASITKILATLPVIMEMEENGEISLNDTFSDFIPEFANSSLKDVTVLKALSHYGRLPAWIPFYLKTLNEERMPSQEYYRNGPSASFPVKVADRLYLSKSYNDSIYARIGRQDLKSNRYRYSDLGYYIFKKIIEDKRNNSLDQIVDQFLYRKIGANSTGFNPLDRIDKGEIIPTEIDDYYRYQEIRGYVHDVGAAMLGGVGGHAGLFSNANDVAKLMQMYLQGGYYGGVRFLSNRTVEKFNKCYFCNEGVRRGVGFDKPDLSNGSPTCNCVSHRSFGHSGFTGTFTWADPDSGILYVFLSNRTYPSATNNQLIRSQLRSRIQQVIYDAIGK